MWYYQTSFFVKYDVSIRHYSHLEFRILLGPIQVEVRFQMAVFSLFFSDLSYCGGVDLFRIFLRLYEQVID